MLQFIVESGISKLRCYVALRGVLELMQFGRAGKFFGASLDSAE